MSDIHQHCANNGCHQTYFSRERERERDNERNTSSCRPDIRMMMMMMTLIQALFCPLHRVCYTFNKLVCGIFLMDQEKYKDSIHLYPWVYQWNYTNVYVKHFGFKQ